ncbi:MAG: DUF433 domain-containing protein [Actinomycetes bacterium]
MRDVLTPGAGVPDRFEVPLYTVSEAARYLDVPASTLRTWANGYRHHVSGKADVVGAPVLTALPRRPARAVRVPFIGLAEGMVLAAVRRSGVPLQRIRPALTRLADEFGMEHALASRRLYTDGAEVLFDYAQSSDDEESARAARELVVVRQGQRVFNAIVESYLHRVDFGDDGYPQVVRLPAYAVADVRVDPRRGFGQPVFARGGARLEDVLALFHAGESLEAVAEEFGMPPKELEDVVRVATRVAA